MIVSFTVQLKLLFSFVRNEAFLCCNMRHLRFMHALLDSIKTTLQPIIDGFGLSGHTLISKTIYLYMPSFERYFQVAHARPAF